MECSLVKSSSCRCGFSRNDGISLNHQESLLKLFSDHTEYTLFYIRKRLSSKKDKDLKAITNRLLQNQDDIGGFFTRVLHNEEVGKKITAALREHILLAAECVENLKGGRTNKLKNSVERLFENSDAIGESLNSLRKRDGDDFRKEFHSHNKFVLDIAIAFAKKEYDLVIELSDAYQNHMSHFGLMVYRDILE